MLTRKLSSCCISLLLLVFFTAVFVAQLNRASLIYSCGLLLLLATCCCCYCHLSPFNFIHFSRTYFYWLLAVDYYVIMLQFYFLFCSTHFLALLFTRCHTWYCCCLSSIAHVVAHSHISFFHVCICGECGEREREKRIYQHVICMHMIWDSVRASPILFICTMSTVLCSWSFHTQTYMHL